MKKKRVNWGILSTAEIAQVQIIPAIQQVSNANLVAIASGSGKAAEAARMFNIPKYYDSYEQLLADPDIDVVYIPLPNGLHSKWVKAAAMSGKHILCEKPAALTEEETKDMIKVCDENQVIFMEALMPQFHPQHQRVKDIIASGEIGDIKLMRSSFTFQLKKLEGNIRMKPELGGGSLYDVGCYCIHATREMLGEPDQVYCVADMHPEYDVDMSAVAVFEYGNGVKAYLDCGMNMSTREDYQIVGTKGTIHVPKAFIPQVDGEGLIIVRSEDGRTREERLVGHNYPLGIEYFSQCLLEGKEPRYTKESTINNVKVIEACLESIRLSKAVKLKEDVCLIASASKM
ncbi:Gfo/Idh/MocA family protein [Ammoniphilus sp. 3BR4]|uniref:Gfo/Idh/MocA family protein n=1 Tax=Ammoniphilus sp. 3BR4 TaxID=3158265 RepID=UPI003467CAEB